MGQHACLKSSIAYETKQAWAAHAVRAHGYRARHSVLARGTQCQACLRCFPSKTKLVKHLQALPKWLAKLEQLEAQGQLGILRDEAGHVQAPPCGQHAVDVEVSVPRPGCSQLLRALCEAKPQSSDVVLQITRTHVEPFECLRTTLEEAAHDDSELTPTAREAVRQLLPRFAVSELCDKGQVLKSVRDSLGFRPLLVPFPRRATAPALQALCIGACQDLVECALQGCPPCQYVPFPDVCHHHLWPQTAVVATVPPPPLACASFWVLHSAPLRVTRLHVQWALNLLHILVLIGQTAACGHSCALRVLGLQAVGFGPLQGWLEASGFELQSSQLGLEVRFT